MEEVTFTGYGTKLGIPVSIQNIRKPYQLDSISAEAIPMIERGPKWIPAEQNGKKVNYLVKQTIVFNVSDK